MDNVLLWSAFGATWLVFIGYSAWSVREHNAIRARMAEIDKTQSIQMARVETELKQISATLIEIKDNMNSRL